MALDPSIILQAGRGVTPLESPMDAMGKALALKNQFQQGQMQNMQMQQQQAAMQRENEFRQSLQQAGGDTQKIQEALTRSGKFKEAAEYAKSLKDAEAAKVGLQNEYLKLGQNERATLQDMVGSVGAAAAAVSKIPDPALKWQKWQETLPQLAMQFAPTETDTPRMREIKTNRIALMQQESQRLMAMQAPQDLDNILAEHLNDAKTKVDWLKEAEQEREAGRFGGFHPAIGEDGKPGIFQSNKAGAIRQVPGLKPVPNQTALMVGGGQLTPEAMAMLVQKYKDTGQLDADIGRNPALRAQIVNAAAKDGPVDLAKAKIQFGTAKQAQDYFTKGKGAGAFRQQETILHHADIFTGIADALQNGNIQAANKIGNALGVQFGADQATNYKIAGQILSAEVGKYLAGGQSTAEERKELAELIPSFSSPQQMKQGLATLKALVEGQRQSWIVQRDAALQGKVPTYASDKGAGSQALPKTVTLADVRANAAKYGKSVDQIIKDLRAKGIGVQ